MIGIGAGVDDEADRPRREPSDRGEQRLGSVRAAGIGHNDAVPPDVHGDVAAGPGDHVEVRLDLEDGERTVALGRPLRGAYRRTRDLAHDDGRTQSRQPSVRADSGAEAPTHDAHVRTSSSLFRTSATPCPRASPNARTYEILLINGTPARRTSSDPGRALIRPAQRRTARAPTLLPRTDGCPRGTTSGRC